MPPSPPRRRPGPSWGTLLTEGCDLLPGPFQLGPGLRRGGRRSWVALTSTIPLEPRLVPPARCRLLRSRLAQPCRPVEQFATAVRTPLVECVGALRAEGAFERADERARCIGGQVGRAAFAGGAHLQHQAAAFRTASQIRSTTCSTCARSSPSAITRITGSVPDGRMTSRPLPASSASASAITALTAS